MASVKITKNMAWGAATKIAAKLCDKKIETCYGRLKGYSDALALRYVPMPVMQVCKEYSSFFHTVSQLMIRCDKNTIYIYTTYRLPEYTHIDVSRNEYDTVRRLKEEKKNEEVNKQKEIEKWANVILSLGTLKRMQDEMPEAVEYVAWPVVRDLPSVKYDVYRDALSSIKKMEGKK